ncbi:MAG: protein-glutamate O-methyltransferase CheR [Desulfotalea sp.]
MDIENIEIRVLIEAIRLRYGHDFRHYAEASLHRRIRHCLKESGYHTIAEMIPLIIHDPKYFTHFFHSLTVNVTEMFRDPSFFQTLRQKVIPYLKTFPFVKIWSVGCSTGQEVYSLAILLREEGLCEKRVLIYATDFNDEVLDIAKQAIYSAEDIRKWTKSYQDAGGGKSFSDYYHADYDSVILDQSLKKNIVFANHNLVTDSVFGEMNLILCRNVLIYFNRELQNQALNLFDQSLCENGFLCLGNKESIKFSMIGNLYNNVAGRERVFQKI